ncbi:KipI family sensor histidine kinase inhibitor [Primorskyibacter sedentarius]|uniref:KipI family sensor histidine kinase inhibitor n=1 Tax=Primorskyibacter sedentarius TaxID=745311 RepID=A0A4R3JK49_9RHOB|nr:KipI family sensor histidine kinase inhibitor [Primorskyibacter sedentarius]
MTQIQQDQAQFPLIRTGGVDGLLVSFGDRLSEPANRAALAFRAAVVREGWDGIEETVSTLVSCFLRFDPLHLSHQELTSKVQALADSRNWYDAALPEGRRFWRVPTVYGTALAPQLEQAAAAAGMSAAEAVASLSEARVRVQALGFAPGQPYLGELPEAWDIPRQSQLTERVPNGALVVAIRQFVLFGVSAPTGWQHVGQTAITLFQPDADEPIRLRPGDEVQFIATDPETLENMRRDPDGGATYEAIR